MWLSVDPLAHEFPSWTPYHYVHNNPINLIDPDGRNAEPPNGFQGESWTDETGSYHNLGLLTGDYGDFVHVDNDGNADLHHTGSETLPEVEVTHTLSKHERTMQNPIVQAVHQAHGDFLRGAAELSAHTLQQTGDITTLAGYGLTLTGVGAPLGVPLAFIGTGMSTVAGGIEAGLHLADGNYTEAATTGAFTLGGRVAPGFIKTKGLGGEILRQNVGLKISGANRLRKSDL